jgi:hypothetical protein
MRRERRVSESLSSGPRLHARQRSTIRERGEPMADLWFVLLTLAVFGLLALCAKGADKL